MEHLSNMRDTEPESQSSLSEQISSFLQTQISDQRMLWCKIEALCRTARWNEVLELFDERKQHFSGMSEPIVFEPFLSLTFQYKGPDHVLGFFFASVKSIEYKFSVAIKYKLYEFALEVAQLPFFFTSFLPSCVP